jgi:eukaryotic-like serine/threonine-protein kinase
MSYEPGQRIGDYEILEVLGAGGMGEVYKVRNVISDRVEAMKILLPDLAGQQELAGRFLREIKVLAGLDHPNIASLRTAQYVGNQLVMIMELVEGTTLAHRLKGGPFPESEAVECIYQVLAALSYAHARGIVHRDIKPANMMLTRDGIIKLMDFGIARAAGENKLTQTGSTLGSIYYMSPEQVQGQNLDSRSDLYSLGVSLYELVTGLHPFEGDTGFTIMKGHIDGTFTPPRTVNPNISPALNEVIMHSMCKDPDDRYQSAEDFSAALQNVKHIIATSPASMPAAPLAGAAMAATTPSRPAFTAPVVAPAVPPAHGPSSGTTATADIGPALTGRVQPLAPPAAPAPATGYSAAPQGTFAVPAPPAYTAPPASAPSPAAKTSGAIVPPPQSVSRSNRALYTGLGVALGIILVVLTAMKLPAFNKGASDAKPAPPATNPAPAPAPVTSATPTPDTTTPPAAPAPSPAADPAAAAAAKKARDEAGAKKAQADAAAAAAAAEAARAAEEAAKLYDEQENRFIHMSSRAAAMKTSYETLRNQQAAAGYSPNASFTQAVSSMDQFLSRAEQALSVHDGATAKKYMDQAEPQIEILERKFGR